MSSPAMMLPRARRVIGLVVVGLFSFIEGIVIMRVYPVWTNRVIRKL